MKIAEILKSRVIQFRISMLGVVFILILSLFLLPKNQKLNATKVQESRVYSTSSTILWIERYEEIIKKTN